MTPSIHSVTILGAGAMGALYAAHFMDGGGIDVRFIAEGERAARIQRDGIRVNGKHYAVPVYSPDDGPADLVIAAVKDHQLPDALPVMRPAVGDDTVILSVMNGLRSEAALAEAFGAERVLLCMALGMDATRESGEVVYTNPGRVFFGEAENRNLSPRVKALQAAFDRAGIQYVTPPDMVRSLWWKFMINVGVNQTSTVMRAPYHVIQSSDDAKALMDNLMREVVALAQAASVDLTEQDVTDWYPILNRLGPGGKTSMLQDFEAGRKTEVEIFAGEVVRMGQQYGVPTPYNDAVLRIIRVLERGIEG